MTPNEICGDVRALLSKLGAKSEPVFLPCAPEPGAELNDCFPVVDRKIESDGGERILGWQIWKSPLLVEAEFHAIWRNTNGSLVDITPKPLPLEKILFLPDVSLSYEGRQIDNVRVNITDNKLVDDFIAVCEAIFRIENLGERAFQYELSLSGNEARAYQFLVEARRTLQAMARRGMNRKSPCLCGSGKKHKVCHGKKIDETVSRY